MYRGRKYRFDWTFSLRCGDFLAVAASFPITVFLLNGIEPHAAPFETNRLTVLNCLFYGAVLLFFIGRFGLYQWKALMQPGSMANRLPAAALAAGVTFLAIRFLVSDTGSPNFLPFLALHFVAVVFLVAAARLVVRTVDLKILRGIPIERIAVVGWSERIERVLKSLQQEMKSFQHTIGFFYDDGEAPEESPAFRAGLRPLAAISGFEKAIEEHDITLVLTEQGCVRWKQLREIIAICADAMVNLRVIPSTFDIWAKRLRVRVLGGIPVMGINDLHHDRYFSRISKRILDIACAVIGILLSAPVIGILAILIKRESPGPVFYRQTRLGLQDKPFQIIKLRSMRLDAEKETGAVWAVGDDPRRLKIGAFMRSWNLDELPQFWNVLTGEMSMVGPRPERPEFVEDFRDTVRYYNLRHTCKPGLTGWAAVHGLRGNTSLEDRLEYDLYYIENWSLALDIRIMLMTLAPPKNAY